jgi:hypothetical protein
MHGGASATRGRCLPIIPIHFHAIANPFYPVCAGLSVDLNLISIHAEEITVKVITIGKRLVPVEQIAFVEPFDPSTNIRASVHELRHMTICEKYPFFWRTP